MTRTLNIAHRGGAGLKPENSLEAFQKAVAMKIDGVEFDVHLWGEELVVAHDEPTGPVKPTFREVLEVIRPSNLVFFAECKTIPKAYPGIARKMVEAITDMNMVERAIFGSFDHNRVVEAKDHNKKLTTCALSSIRIHDPGRYVRSIGADLYGPSVDVIGLRNLDGRVRKELIDSCDKADVPVWVYTVNEIKDMEKLMNAGASAIMTDYPDRLKELME